MIKVQSYCTTDRVFSEETLLYLICIAFPFHYYSRLSKQLQLNSREHYFFPSDQIKTLSSKSLIHSQSDQKHFNTKSLSSSFSKHIYNIKTRVTAIFAPEQV